MEGVRDKNLTDVLLFVDFFKAFDSIRRGPENKRNHPSIWDSI